jgi:anthranilate/para-aminobenzoate synthase component II
VSARSESGLIMGLRNTSLKIEGIQFHPESIATDYGKQIIDNFIKIYKS